MKQQTIILVNQYGKETLPFTSLKKACDILDLPYSYLSNKKFPFTYKFMTFTRTYANEPINQH